MGTCKLVFISRWSLEQGLTVVCVRFPLLDKGLPKLGQSVCVQ